MPDERLIPSIPYRGPATPESKAAHSLLSSIPANPAAADDPSFRTSGSPTSEISAESTSSDPNASLHDRVVEVLKSIYDPEIPVNIYELGLIYGVEVDDHDVFVSMTLTSPACPVAGTLPGEVETKIQALDGVDDTKVDLTWDPPWTPERMSEEAKLLLNLPY